MGGKDGGTKKHLFAETQERYLAYIDATLEQVGALRARHEADLRETQPSTTEHDEASEGVMSMDRIAIRLRAQRAAAVELYDCGLGPLSDSP